MRYMKLAVICCLAWTSGGLATPSLHSELQIAKTKKNDETCDYQFKITPQGDLVINTEGPWQLEVQDLSSGLQNQAKSQFEPQIPGFAQKAPCEVPKGLEVKMVAFICTKDKTICYRDVHRTGIP